MGRKIGEVRIWIAGEDSARVWDVMDCGCAAISPRTQIARAERRHVSTMLAKGLIVRKSEQVRTDS